jgi:hypothetical protein
LVASPTGTEIGAPVQAVGLLHGDGPHGVVTDVLGDLKGQRGGLVAERALDVQRVIDLRKLIRSELDVDDRADDSGDPADPRDPAVRRGGRAGGDGHGVLDLH